VHVGSHVASLWFMSLNHKKIFVKENWIHKKKSKCWVSKMKLVKAIISRCWKPPKVVNFGLIVVHNGIVVYGSISYATFLLIHGQWGDGWHTCKNLRKIKLFNCVIYCSYEPCPMSFAMMYLAWLPICAHVWPFFLLSN